MRRDELRIKIYEGRIEKSIRDESRGHLLLRKECLNEQTSMTDQIFLSDSIKPSDASIHDGLCYAMHYSRVIMEKIIVKFTREPNSLHEILEEFVVSVIHLKVRSCDLHRYAHKYFTEHDKSNRSMEMDDETEQQMRQQSDEIEEADETDGLSLPPAHSDKTKDEQEFLRSAIPQSLPFHALDRSRSNREHDEEDYFYWVQSGVYEAKINDKIVTEYNNKGSFGELALLYLQSRQATVTCSFVKRCDILKNVSDKELLDITDCMKEGEYILNDAIIQEGDEANAMYYIENGQIEIRVKDEKTGKHLLVKTCNSGEYFGERVFLFNDKRAASAIATTYCKLLTLDRNNFDRLFGSVKSILKRNASNYDTILKQIQNRQL
ncbi:unnamed protein product [Didymodactylos carnosus]|uniref:Cyclic nucleotide-binding domain-containing protein n=1 Tax=Didymodactylos carnosus TaxID=1234261 RepID=A0A814FDB4_9BILA|nr:unnamed protein product [Didymodactylos carnosus]CAF0981702.1 unnamed protein product [Didymodactylos carnosus]CAF3749703.1 unnamed protein product [Didymodactylos carnosus]CAF3754226.1 unnamed protein product [Didymodactylos carnosus]